MSLMGFSTGALSYGDFESALRLIRSTSITAVELSALRLPELPKLIDALRKIDLKQFTYISFHAPSRFSEEDEDQVIELLLEVPKTWPIILHPDAIFDAAKWLPFGSQITIENMDRRKPTGRSADELCQWFELLPDARLCLDLAHAHQCDRTMTDAFRILQRFKSKICQLHISELDSTGRHYPLSFGSIQAFREIASLLPEETPAILESVNPFLGADEEVQVAWIEREMEKASEAIGSRRGIESESPFSQPVADIYTAIPV